jgi:hypothetical protein
MASSRTQSVESVTFGIVDADISFLVELGEQTRIQKFLGLSIGFSGNLISFSKNTILVKKSQ